jgi:DNA-binding NarL/FixJ family response regulator
MSASAARQLRAAIQLKQRAAQQEREAVLAARREGWTWQRIAAQLGISHQATMKKYAAAAAADMPEADAPA